MDTDHLSLLDQDTMEGFNLSRRLAAMPPGEIAVTIITYEEQMRGWLAYTARANTIERMLTAYARLQRHVETFKDIPVVPFDEKAAAEFERLRQAKIRIGSMDLKIAAIALAMGATLLTRNLSDFGKIPGLRIEDWTV
jgi:tRNA(fMet)-specific endonuclease VapC